MFAGIRWRLVSYCLAILAVAVLVMGVFFTSFLNYFYRESLRDHLFAQANLASLLLKEALYREGPAADLDSLCGLIAENIGVRVTLVDADGHVLADSKDHPVRPENYLYLPEVQEALRSGKGSASRYSAAAGKEIFYTAVQFNAPNTVADGQERFRGFILLAVPLSEIHAPVTKIQRFTFAVLIGATLTALLAGVLLSIRITVPLKEISAAARAIASGDFNPVLKAEGKDEIAGLARTIREMGLALQKKVYQITLEKNKLDAVISAADSGMIMFDRFLRLELLNPAAENLFDLKKENSIGSPVQTVLRNYSLFENLQKVYLDGRPRNFVLNLYYPRSIILQVSLIPVAGAGEDTTGVLALFHDITALRSVEQMRTDFVANVSHELRTPLTAIKGYTETILDQNLTGDELADFLMIIDREAERLARLVDSLLELSRIEEHKEVISKGRVDLVSLCQQSLQDVEEARRRKNVDIFTTFPAGPVYVHGNPEWLRQAMVNILDNSIKYGRFGGKVNVKVYRIENAAGVEIADDGPGIPETDLPHVFERFYRVDKARTRTAGGAGLGLAIVKHIMEAHGAVYTIESETGRGTVFRFLLPIHQATTT